MNNPILDAAAHRAERAHAGTQVNQQAEVARLREDIGVQYVTLAQAQLPDIEKAMRTIYRPFIAELTAIGDTTGTPLAQWESEMSGYCETVPNRLRGGIEKFRTLEFRHIVYKDGVSVDVNKRAEKINEVRGDLRAGDGALSRLRLLKGQAETYIKDSGWPNVPGQTGPMTTGTLPGRETHPEITVES